MRTKMDIDILFNPDILGVSVRQAEEMVKEDKVCERRKLQNEKDMKEHGITAAEMAGMMH